MFKKIAALILIAVVSYIALPLGYGFWDENIGVSGTISFAEATPPSPSQAKCDEAICSTEVSAEGNAAASSDSGIVTGQDLNSAEPAASEQAEAEDSGKVSDTESRAVSSAVSSAVSTSESASESTAVSGETSTSNMDNTQASNVPEAIQPVEASDNPTN